MISYGQKRLNKKDVQKGTRNFIISFLILCGVTFATVYLFFKSSDMQSRQIIASKTAYEDMIKRSYLLNQHLDKIYIKMNKMTDATSREDNLVVGQILDDIQTAKKIIGADSTADLKEINMLISNLEPMINFKNELQKKKLQEDRIAVLLNRCYGQGQAAEQIIKKKEKPVGRLFK